MRRQRRRNGGNTLGFGFIVVCRIGRSVEGGHLTEETMRRQKGRKRPLAKIPASIARILAMRHMLSEMEETKKFSVGPTGSYSASTSEVCFWKTLSSSAVTQTIWPWMPERYAFRL